MNEGEACAVQCGFVNDQWGPTRDCPQFCGTLGTCCSAFDWERGAPGCELAMNVTGGQMVCGAFRAEGPAIRDFRTGPPRGSGSRTSLPTGAIAITCPNTMEREVSPGASS